MAVNPNPPASTAATPADGAPASAAEAASPFAGAPAPADLDAAIAAARAAAEAEARSGAQEPAPAVTPAAPPDATASGLEAEPTDGAGDEADTGEPVDLASLSRRQRGALLDQVREQLDQERQSREQAESSARAQQEYAERSRAVFTELTGTDEHLAELRRRARAGDSQAAQMRDVYEANRELLEPLYPTLTEMGVRMGWARIGADFQAGAEHLPESKRAEFLRQPDIKAGMGYFAEQLTAPLKAENAALKAENAALKIRAGLGGPSPVTGGRAAPASSSLDQYMEQGPYGPQLSEAGIAAARAGQFRDLDLSDR